MPDMQQGICARCGAAFPMTKPNRRYCGLDCQVAANRADTKSKRNRPLVERLCGGCEQVFMPAQQWQRWCSRACGDRWRQRLYRELDGPPSIVRPCDYCTTEFSSVDGRQKYCGAECAAIAKSLRQAFRLYGITMQEYRAMWLRQDGKCAVCRLPERTERNRLLTVDHDHVTGHIRELLCSQCNRAIGLLQDDPKVIRRAAEYVERNRQLRLLT